MGLKLEFTLELEGASKVALQVDHDRDGLIDEEKPVSLTRHRSGWIGTVEVNGDDPTNTLYLYTVTTQRDASTFTVTILRADTREQIGKTFTGPIGKGNFYLAHWVEA